MNHFRNFAAVLLFALYVQSALANIPSQQIVSVERSDSEFVGGVYAMSNNVTANTLIVYARRSDGTLSLLNGALRTGGRGAVLNPLPGGADPLVSAFSLTIVGRRFVLAVNAGSNSVSVFRILPDFNLRLVSVRRVPGVGTVSITTFGSIVYVASADTDGVFDSFDEQTGLLNGFRLTSGGRLIPLRRSLRRLSFRPATIRFSPDGRSLLVSDGSFVGLAGFDPASPPTVGSFDELTVFRVSRSGRLSLRPVATAISTPFGNSDGRNLPTAIGFDVTRVGSTQFVIVPEVRFIGPDGTLEGFVAPDGAFSGNFQTSSVSIWRLTRTGRLIPAQLDVLVGTSLSDGQIAACWAEVSADSKNFWVANTGSGTVSAFSFENGRARLLDEVAGRGPRPIGLWSTADSKFVYQMFGGFIGVFEVTATGLNLLQTPMDVPEFRAQGIVAF